MTEDQTASAAPASESGPEPGPAEAMNDYYQTWLKSAGTVVQNSASFQSDLNKAAGASITNGVTQIYALSAAATARAVALMASAVHP
ncbi:RebB family R body protein [Kordiimonas marina]|uniref:RebB family R body protein n=1 Tax=Kordiimonas marina TaxID=2872312 RepID=UPI001FF2FA69|nr:RebB family R body protein [Kordiimonas marina]MCJ9429363.1 RebB family R body protein [Kordiimonas marina]